MAGLADNCTSLLRLTPAGDLSADGRLPAFLCCAQDQKDDACTRTGHNRRTFRAFATVRDS
jgi:hypothetical protein